MANTILEALKQLNKIRLNESPEMVDDEDNDWDEDTLEDAVDDDTDDNEYDEDGYDRYGNTREDNFLTKKMNRVYDRSYLPFKKKLYDNEATAADLNNAMNDYYAAGFEYADLPYEFRGALAGNFIIRHQQDPEIASIMQQARDNLQTMIDRAQRKLEQYQPIYDELNSNDPDAKAAAIETYKDQLESIVADLKGEMFKIGGYFGGDVRTPYPNIIGNVLMALGGAKSDPNSFLNKRSAAYDSIKQIYDYFWRLNKQLNPDSPYSLFESVNSEAEDNDDWDTDDLEDAIDDEEEGIFYDEDGYDQYGCSRDENRVRRQHNKDVQDLRVEFNSKLQNHNYQPSIAEVHELLEKAEEQGVNVRQELESEIPFSIRYLIDQHLNDPEIASIWQQISGNWHNITTQEIDPKLNRYHDIYLACTSRDPDISDTALQEHRDQFEKYIRDLNLLDYYVLHKFSNQVIENIKTPYPLLIQYVIDVINNKSGWAYTNRSFIYLRNTIRHRIYLATNELQLYLTNLRDQER